MAQSDTTPGVDADKPPKTTVGHRKIYANEVNEVIADVADRLQHTGDNND